MSKFDGVLTEEPTVPQFLQFLKPPISDLGRRRIFFVGKVDFYLDALLLLIIHYVIRVYITSKLL